MAAGLIAAVTSVLPAGSVPFDPPSPQRFRTAAPAHASAPRVAVVADTELDPTALYFVSYDGLVNNQAFQQNAVISHAGYQYAGWFTATRHAMLARRRLPAGRWEILQLPHQLSTDDSHNVISLGISPADGRLHVAMDTHGTPLYYMVSEPGLASDPAGKSWDATRFGPVQRRLGDLELGPITYPQFVVTPDGRLQLSYRFGATMAETAMELAEYDGAWRRLGKWQQSGGRYTTGGVHSDVRGLYPYGIGYGPDGRLHVAFTWREGNPDVLCSPGGLSNHDVGYVYSDDRGRSWRNDAGTAVAVTGGAPQLSIDSPGLVVQRIDVNRGLMNQESQQVDARGNPHVLISYVPRSVDRCVDHYAPARTARAQLFHLVRDGSGTWRQTLIPVPLRATGRSQIVFDAHDNIYVVMPYGRVVTASRASGWNDWSVRFDGAGLNAFGELVVDRSRVGTDGVMSVLYQQRSTGTTPSPIRVVDFRLG